MNYVRGEFPKGATHEAPLDFSASEKSLIVSILSVGTFFGALIAPLFSDSVGRKPTLIVSTLLVFNLGVILQTVATDIPLLCAGRAIAGFGVGLISSCIPLYQSETTPKWIRGAVVSCYQWAITIGLLLAACVNQGTHNRNDSGSYRIPIAIQFLWSLILGIGMIFLPESPRFYIAKRKNEKAIESLGSLRKLPLDHPDLIEEYEEIKANFEYESSVSNSSWLNVFSPSNKQLKRLITGVSLQAFQQLTGVNFIFYFGASFFESAGVSGFINSLAANIVNVGMTVPGVLLIELIGRRKLLLGGAICMSISQLIIAIVGVTSSSDNTASNQVLVAFTCIFIGSFAASWGPTCWAVCGEIFPLTTRAKSIALCTASNWLINWAIAYATPYLVDSGPGNANLGTNVFFIWGGCNVLCGVFTYFMVYETKGLTLEQVDELYENVSNAWQSHKFTPSPLTYREELSEDANKPQSSMKEVASQDSSEELIA